VQRLNKPAPKQAERRHIARVAELPCSVCDAAGPSEVHEIKQGVWHLAVALCPSCHRNSKLGWHVDRRMWALKKMDDLDALAVTLRRLL
jgi:hypothetical protein